MITEAKGFALSCVFSGQVNWSACSRNRKEPRRHSSPPDEENSNYSGKSIFNPISPLSTKKLLGGREGDRKIYIPDSISGVSICEAPLFFFRRGINGTGGLALLEQSLENGIFFFFIPVKKLINFHRFSVCTNSVCYQTFHSPPNTRGVGMKTDTAITEAIY